MSRGARPHVRFVITTSDFGGSESFLSRLVRGMDRQRFDLSVCSLCPPGRVAQEIEALGIPVSTLGMARRAKPLQMLAAVRTLARRVDRDGVDLVQSLLYRANVLSAVACRWSRSKPKLVTGQRSLIPTGRSLDFLAQKWTRDWADRVVAVSEAVRTELLDTESIASDKVVVIQNGIDVERFAPGTAEERAAARAAWNVADDQLVIGAVGRIHGPKGLPHLVDAFALARRQDPRLILVLAGDGPASDVEALDAKILEHELGEHVRRLGYVKAPGPLYAGFDLYALPSLKEGSPNALLEAMGRGCASIASAVGGVPEAAVDGESGLLVPPADPPALAEAISRLAGDPELRRRLGEAARSRIVERFDLGTMIRSHEALYSGLLAATHRP
ncbi:MAG: glycosyltransferase [Acidobacteriota bacterium]